MATIKTQQHNDGHLKKFSDISNTPSWTGCCCCVVCSIRDARTLPLDLSLTSFPPSLIRVSPSSQFFLWIWISRFSPPWLLLLDPGKDYQSPSAQGCLIFWILRILYPAILLLNLCSDQILRVFLGEKKILQQYLNFFPMIIISPMFLSSHDTTDKDILTTQCDFLSV